MIKRDKSLFIRNFTFGVEDSLVSTVGLLAGIAVVGVAKETIIITGLVLIFVEGFSMAVGSLVSERSVEEYERKTTSFRSPFRASIIMLLSYILAGIIPLAPYFYFTGRQAWLSSIALSLVALFVLGAINGRIANKKMFGDGVFTLAMGGVAILVGIIVGQVSQRLL